MPSSAMPMTDAVSLLFISSRGCLCGHSYLNACMTRQVLPSIVAFWLCTCVFVCYNCLQVTFSCLLYNAHSDRNANFDLSYRSILIGVSSLCRWAFVALDLAKAPAHFDVTSLFWQYNYDVADRATQDSCAACGICNNINECPLTENNFPNNSPDICEPSGTSNSTVDGRGAFTL